MVLPGGEPARGSSRSVPMTEIVQAALARIDDDRVHVLVEVGQVAERCVDGGAAADLAELLAELIANAVAACSPVARVRVAGQAVTDRYALEVQDRGVGASSDEVDRVSAPLVECVPQRLFALFERVACRHGVNVRLCRSSHGGINALILLPRELLVVGVVGPGPAGPLPRRVPMTSMPTELRDAPAGSGQAWPTWRPAPSRSPDEVRAFLSSYHDGIRRARTDAHPAGPEPTGPGHHGAEPSDTRVGYAPAAGGLPDDHDGAAAIARLRDLVVPIAAGTPA